MNLSLATNGAPAKEPIGLADAKRHLHIDVGNRDEDDYIDDLITAAREEAEDELNRALITQTWEGWLDAFPDDDHIDMSLPPLQSVSSIDYYDTANVKATMTATDYFVDTKGVKGRIVLAYGKTWPSTTLRPANGVCVTFVAGYGDDAADVPQVFRNAIKLLVSARYTGDTNQAKADREAAERLLGYRRLVPV